MKSAVLSNIEILQTFRFDLAFRVHLLFTMCFKGLAIRDYWSLGKEGQKDDKYIVLVVDQFGGRGNILNFNVGDVSLQSIRAISCNFLVKRICCCPFFLNCIPAMQPSHL